jgi:WD40 repeat protein
MTVKIWDVNANSTSYEKCVATLANSTGHVTSVTWSPDGESIVAGSGDGSVKIWDVMSRKCTSKFKTSNCGTVSLVAYSPDGKSILAFSKDKRLRLWDIDSKECVSTLTVSNDSYFGTVVAYNHDRTRIVAGTTTEIKIWQQEKNKSSMFTSHSIKWKFIKRWYASDFISSICYNHNGTFIVAGLRDKNCLQVFDANSGHCVATLNGHEGFVYSVSFSRDGTRIASGSNDNTIKIWDVSDLLPQAGGKKNAIKKKIKKINRQL